MILARMGLLMLSGASLALAGCSQGGDKDPVDWPSGKPVQPLAGMPSAVPTAASPSTIDFGDDGGKYARDGECDDKRFSGVGMTETPLLDADVKHDASDCRSALNQGRLTFKGEGPEPARYDSDSPVDRIIWGDDTGKYARDGECDDKRFAGAGMTDTPLLDSDIKHDATDCRSAFSQGRLTLRE